jgi:cytochrome b
MRRIARPYAKALLGVAGSLEEAGKVRDQLAGFGATLAGDAKLQAFFQNPGLPLDAKRRALDQLAYLRGQAHPDHLIGHNPLGAGSVYAMLLVLLAQVGTGLVADDEIAFTGPLNRFVSSARGLAATWYHKELGQLLLIALVLLHLGAIAYYAVGKKQNLVGPMVQGDKEVATPAVSSRDDAVSRAGAAVVLVVAAAIVTWLVRLGTAG